jgi:hypothetical protein
LSFTVVYIFEYLEGIYTPFGIISDISPPTRQTPSGYYDEVIFFFGSSFLSDFEN